MDGGDFPPAVAVRQRQADYDGASYELRTRRVDGGDFAYARVDFPPLVPAGLSQRGSKAAVPGEDRLVLSGQGFIVLVAFQVKVLEVFRVIEPVANNVTAHQPPGLLGEKRN